MIWSNSDEGRANRVDSSITKDQIISIFSNLQYLFDSGISLFAMLLKPIPSTLEISLLQFLFGSPFSSD